jgi:molecular chaperone IbpA
LAYRNFKQTFNLADHVKVSAANLENGLLAIELTREIPEQLKPRRIDVQSVTPPPAREKAPELTAKAA